MSRRSTCAGAPAGTPLRVLLPSALGVAVVLGAPCARAEPSRTDGAYGRLAGDLAFALEAGVLEAFPGELVSGRLSTCYLHTVGLYAAYADSLDVGAPALARTTAAGLELRPLFLARFTSDLEKGPAALDLWLDSFALGLGLYGAAAGERACVGDGLGCWTTGIELGLGMELPLLARIDGPFVAARGAARWPVAIAPEGASNVEATQGVVTLSLGYRVQLDSSLVEAADAR